MNGLQLALLTLHRGEQHLSEKLTTAAARHCAEHEVYHVATDIAAWSSEHMQGIADASAQHDLNLDEHSDTAWPDVSPVHGHKIHKPPPGSCGPGLLLLRDLRDLHLAAAYNSLHWEMLAQVAQASGATDLLSLASSCHPQTLRQMRWTNTMIKNMSPQILNSL
ncbi:hypothetical protein [Streptomyces sp. HB132]|uniref:hypothetical protein n=1 Tax=Streptomyces sp. HB132 TaxID=767388 RepID=UPI0019612AE6|nr:hypothetical protein [Streptomyces sp. HB132]MBM7443226.1 hypothetical protein [Streptomyces sp. HB132]